MDIDINGSKFSPTRVPIEECLTHCIDPLGRIFAGAKS
jgi:hypothetical protein